jgi:hypothetical protein
VAIIDDLNLIGIAKDVLTAFDNFESDLVGTGLMIRKEKCGFLWPRGTLCPDDLRAAATQRAIPVHLGTMKTLSVMLGAGDADISR